VRHIHLSFLKKILFCFKLMATKPSIISCFKKNLIYQLTAQVKSSDIFLVQQALTGYFEIETFLLIPAGYIHSNLQKIHAAFCRAQ